MMGRLYRNEYREKAVPNFLSSFEKSLHRTFEMRCVLELKKIVVGQRRSVRGSGAKGG